MTGPFPWHRPAPTREPAEYARLRDTDPIARVELATGLVAHVVTRHDHMRRLLTDPRAGSDRAHPGYPYYIEVPQRFRTDSGFLGIDPPAHTVQRRLTVMSGEFTKVRVQAIIPRLQEIVDSCVDRMLEAGPPVDLVRMLALRVPLTAVCGILGIPEEEHDFLHGRTDVLLGGASTPQQRLTAFHEVNGYLEDLVERRDRVPGADLISRIIRKYRDEGIFDLRAIVNNLRLLINAGHETSASMIANGTLTLLEHPEQLADFKSDPDGLAEDMVEELLRYLTPADLATCRVAVEDIAVDDHVIPAGEGIILLGLSANRDPEAFPEPDRFDIRRGSRQHLAFGSGVHHCIGAELARTELKVVFTTLFRRIPDLRLAKPSDELRFKDGNIIYSVYEMPVIW